MSVMSMIPMEFVEGYTRLATGALVSAVWQGAVLAGLAALGLRLVPKASAAVRFAVWAGVFGLIAVLPFVPVWSGAGAGQAAGRILTVDARWSLVIAAVWAALSVWRTGTLVVAAARLRGLWLTAVPVEERFVAGSSAVEQSSITHPGAMKPRRGWATRRVEVCTSNEVDRPSVIGFWSPRILIPTWLYARLTRAELEQIVLHEAGHLRRSDDWVNLLQKIALVVFPLNPALLWVERKLCFERELACDEGVLATTGAPKAYATCLATLAEHRMGRRGLALALGVMERVSELEQRVASILQGGRTMGVRQTRLVMSVAVLGLLGGAAELVRCPQLVGFESAGLRAQGSGISVPAGYRVQDVAYRPMPASVHQWQPNHDGGTVMNGATESKDGSRGARITHPLSQGRSKDGPPEFVAQGRQAAPVTGWVVVTSWSAEDGSRMVLTETEMQMGSAEDSAASVRPDASGAVPTGKPSQFHRYAAVPVHDGWLVFQL
jgi:beta-lactamase regulating signal transducer with metallopeptidase domain